MSANRIPDTPEDTAARSPEGPASEKERAFATYAASRAAKAPERITPAFTGTRYVSSAHVIEAVRVNAADWNGSSFDGCPFDALPGWLQEAVEDGIVVPDCPGSTDYAVWFAPHTGERAAEPGDWIVRDNTGEIFTCDAALFAATYEPHCDSDKLPKGEDSRSEAECGASQSGGSEASASPTLPSGNPHV